MAAKAVYSEKELVIKKEHDSCFPVLPLECEVTNHTQEMVGSSSLERETSWCRAKNNLLEVMFLYEECDQLTPETRCDWREEKQATVEKSRYFHRCLIVACCLIEDYRNDGREAGEVIPACWRWM